MSLSRLLKRIVQCDLHAFSKVDCAQLNGGGIGLLYGRVAVLVINLM